MNIRRKRASYTQIIAMGFLLLIAAGTNLQTVAARLGHSSINTTAKIYAHAIQAAADTLQDLLHPLAQ